MVKELIHSYLNAINALDASSDTVMTVDYENHSIMFTQVPGQHFLCEDAWITLKTDKQKGKTNFVISFDKLKYIKEVLMYYLNHSADCQFIPSEHGFAVLENKEILYKNQMIQVWVKVHEVNYKINWFSKLLLKWTSKEYNQIVKSLNNIKVQ